jgi:hypothetical protein
MSFKIYCKECGGFLSKVYKTYLPANHQAWGHTMLHAHDAKVVEAGA